MPFKPPFMQRFDEFTRERDQVRSVEDLEAFNRKWFTAAAWPTKTAEQYTQDQAHKRGPLKLGGRSWSYFSDGLDLDPVARYEIQFTLHQVGDPIVFPHMAGVPRDATAGWVQECGYCEISTRELGDETCPRCGRKLYYANYTE